MGTKLDEHVRWHHWAHLIFAVANLVVLGWSCYHLARYDGFGFYDYSHDGKGTYNAEKIWDTTLVEVETNLGNKVDVPRWIHEVMKDTCNSGDNYWVKYDNDDWNWKPFKQKIESMGSLDEIHLDFGNPVDRIVLDVNKDHFPVCAKGIKTQDSRDAYMAICTELGYVGEGDNSAPHANATHARNTLIALAVLSAVFFILQVVHFYYDVKAHGKGSLKFYRHRHAVTTKPEALNNYDNTYAKIPVTAWITYLGHFAMYAGAVFVSCCFLAFVVEEEKGKNPGFDFTAYDEYTKDNCHVTPYAPALHRIAEKMKKDTPNGTVEYRVSIAIVSTYLVLGVVMTAFYSFYLAAMNKDTFIAEDNLDKVEDTEDIVEPDPEDSDNYDTYGMHNIGKSIAGTLFRRGKKLVELKF